MPDRELSAERKQRLLQRVTQPDQPGRPLGSFQPPPPPRPTPAGQGSFQVPQTGTGGVRHGLPLPTGVPVTESGEKVPPHLLQAARQQVDEETAAVAAEMAAQALRAGTGGPQLGEPVRIEDLPPERQQEVRDALAAATRKGSFRIPQPQAAAPAPQGEVVADVPPAAEREPEPEETTFDRRDCPQCHWPLQRSDTVEVSDRDQSVFLQSWLGRRPFTKAIPLFGGRVRLTFRTLTTKESDLIATYVAHQARSGEIQTLADQLELQDRCRLALQLRTVEEDGVVIDELPEALDRDRNPRAGSFWKLPDGVSGAEALTAVMEEVLDTVLSTEGMHRMAVQAFHVFERTAARLEALAGNPDFTFATDAPP